jgi:phage protein D
MSEPKHFIKHSNALNLARSLIKKERLTVSQVLEHALEPYAHVEQDQEAAPDFYARIAREYGADMDLDAFIRKDRKPNSGVDF